VLDTPISETAFIGLGIGAAVEGMRPIDELMFADFFGVCMDQIYNHMAKIHFESGGNVRVPMLLMTAVGGGYSDAAQHSQCLWGTFAHLPGMKVVVPSNPADAKGLMIAAIRDDNPVVYMFHKGVMGLPWMAKNPRAIGTCAASCRWTAKRSTCVAKTGRLLVVDEDHRSFGLSGEIAATVAEHDPTLLRAPVRRVAVPDVPIPYARPLEQAVLPTRSRIRAAALELVRR
jgi:pyruvate dehydrogenase E1 component beta subunit